MRAVNGFKICPRCEKSDQPKGPQPVDNFHRNATAKDGLQPYCKKCLTKAVRASEHVRRLRLIEAKQSEPTVAA